MKLISQQHSEYKGKKYSKFWVVIPQKLIDALGWKAGEELEPKVEKDRLVIKRK